jgi:hypothetical protein
MEVGELVFAKQDKKHKYMTPFNPEPHKVVAVNKSMVSVRDVDGREFTRDRSFFKRAMWVKVVRYGNERPYEVLTSRRIEPDIQIDD